MEQGKRKSNNAPEACSINLYAYVIQESLITGKYLPVAVHHLSLLLLVCLDRIFVFIDQKCPHKWDI